MDFSTYFERISNGFRPIFNVRIFNFSKFFENPVKILRDDPPTLPKASRTIPKICLIFSFCFDFLLFDRFVFPPLTPLFFLTIYLSVVGQLNICSAISPAIYSKYVFQLLRSTKRARLSQQLIYLHVF